MLTWLCKILRPDEWLVEPFTDASGAWRWRIRARNGEIVASSEAYSSQQACEDTARKLTKVKLRWIPF